MTPYEAWFCLFTDTIFDSLVEQTQLYATQLYAIGIIFSISLDLVFISLLVLFFFLDITKYLKRGIIDHPKLICMCHLLQMP